MTRARRQKLAQYLLTLVGIRAPEPRMPWYRQQHVERQLFAIVRRAEALNMKPEVLVSRDGRDALAAVAQVALADHDAMYAAGTGTISAEWRYVITLAKDVLLARGLPLTPLAVDPFRRDSGKP